MRTRILSLLSILLWLPARADAEVTTYRTTSASLGRTVPWNYVPPAVRNSIQYHAGTTSMVRVEETALDGQRVYRAAVQRDGVPGELLLLPDGNLFSDMNRLNWSNIPPQVQQTYSTIFDLSALFTIHVHDFNGLQVYDFTVNNLGQRGHLQIAADGTTLSYIEEPQAGVGVTTLGWEDLPAPVRNGIATQAGSAQIQKISRGMFNGQIVYNVSLNDGLSQTELRFASNGTLLDGGTVITEAAGASQPVDGLTLYELPEPARSTINAYTGAEPIYSIRPAALDGRLCYEVTFDKMGETMQVYVTQEGDVLP